MFTKEPASIPDVSVINVAIDKQGKTSERRLLRHPPRLLHRSRPTLRQTQTRPEGRNRRSRVVRAVLATTGQPFPKPESGKIAVKVFNHSGDEVLKVDPVT
jgi:hypothetical protein